jgi:ABC-type multidrug transport system fused ATPase/permease subunit
MGANSSCPAGFERGMFFSCRAQCPPEFKYVQTSGGTAGPPSESCVHMLRNDRSFPLISLPSEGSEAIYAEERARVANETQRVKREVEEDTQKATSLGEYKAQRRTLTQEYSRIQGDYANYSSNAKVAKELEEVTKSLTPFRPPTAPSSDLEIERKAILAISQKDMFFIQIALFLAVLSLLAYIVLPTDYAHGLALLFLSVAISFGFFLRK